MSKNIAKEKFSAMSKLLTSKKLQLKTKMNILKSYIYSIFTYGCETWTLSKANENKIEVFEMWCLRYMSNIQWKDHVRNEDVLQKVQTPILLDVSPTRAKLFLREKLSHAQN